MRTRKFGKLMVNKVISAIILALVLASCGAEKERKEIQRWRNRQNKKVVDDGLKLCTDSRCPKCGNFVWDDKNRDVSYIPSACEAVWQAETKQALDDREIRQKYSK